MAVSQEAIPTQHSKWSLFATMPTYQDVMARGHLYTSDQLQRWHRYMAGGDVLRSELSSTGVRYMENIQRQHLDVTRQPVHQWYTPSTVTLGLSQWFPAYSSLRSVVSWIEYAGHHATQVVTVIHIWRWITMLISFIAFTLRHGPQETARCYAKRFRDSFKSTKSKVKGHKQLADMEETTRLQHLMQVERGLQVIGPYLKDINLSHYVDEMTNRLRDKYQQMTAEQRERLIAELTQCTAEPREDPEEEPVQPDETDGYEEMMPLRGGQAGYKETSL